MHISKPTGRLAEPSSTKSYSKHFQNNKFPNWSCNRISYMRQHADSKTLKRRNKTPHLMRLEVNFLSGTGAKFEPSPKGQRMLNIFTPTIIGS